MDIETLHKIQLQEKRGGVLATLEKTFFAECFEFIDLKRQLLEANYSALARNDLDNAILILRDILTKRQQKIILKALNDFKSNANSIEGLTNEEADFYVALLDLLNRHSLKINSQISGEKKLVKVKILSEVPEFIGKNSKSLGPFAPDQEVELDSGDAKTLISRNLAVSVTA